MLCNDSRILVCLLRRAKEYGEIEVIRDTGIVVASISIVIIDNLSSELFRMYSKNKPGKRRVRNWIYTNKNENILKRIYISLRDRTYNDINTI